MSQDRKYREFWVKATRVRNGLKSYTATIAPIHVAGEIHVIEIAALDELKAENERLAFDRDNLSQSFFKLQQSASDGIIALESKNAQLTDALRDMVVALDHYKGISVSDKFGPHNEATDALTRVASDCLAKHADLIGKLTPRKDGKV